MEYDASTALWDKHPGWRLLRATNAPLVLTFLGHHFVEENQGATAAGPLAGALDEAPLQLLASHAALVLGHDIDKPRNLAKSVTVE